MRKGCKYFVIFNQNGFLSLKQYEVDSWLLWITSRKSYVVDRSVLVPPTLSDLEK